MSRSLPDLRTWAVQLRIAVAANGRHLYFLGMTSRGERVQWERPLAVAASVSALAGLVLTLGLGALTVSVSSGVGCFGDEPGCAGDAAPTGMDAVQSSSWMLSALAATAVIVALLLSTRVRRPAHLIPVGGLCAVAVTIIVLLWSRL